MKKQTLALALTFALMSTALAGPALCSPDAAPVPREATIKGQDCQVLKDFFSRFEQEKTNKVPSEDVKRVLLNAMPEAYEGAWVEEVSRAGAVIDVPASVTVRVLYVEGRKEDKPIRALITFTLLLRAKEASATCYDEKLAALVVRRDAAVLSLMEQGNVRKAGRLIQHTAGERGTNWR